MEKRRERSSGFKDPGFLVISFLLPKVVRMALDFVYKYQYCFEKNCFIIEDSVAFMLAKLESFYSQVLVLIIIAYCNLNNDNASYSHCLLKLRIS